jgi:beta-xylosidase
LTRSQHRFTNFIVGQYFAKMAPTFLYTFASALVMSGFTIALPTRAIDSDFADPCVVQDSDGYYAFATSGNGVNVQVATSPDFATWNLLSGTDAMPGPFPAWVAGTPAIWAPDVIQRVSLTTVIHEIDRQAAHLF